MIDSCTRKRMIASIIALLACTTVVLLVEEYVEENQLEATKIFRKLSSSLTKRGEEVGPIAQQMDPLIGPVIGPLPTHNTPTVTGTASSRCDSDETTVLTKSCVRCSKKEELENASYCGPTGHYNTYRCATSGREFRAACLLRDASAAAESAHFRRFALASAAGAALFGAFVRWRRAAVERKVYTRLPQTA